MDDAAWGALALALTALGGIYTWFAFRNRGFVPGLRGVGFTIIPVALLLTDTLQLVTDIGGEIGSWVGNFAFSPAAWLGIILAVVSVGCFGPCVGVGVGLAEVVGVGVSTSTRGTRPVV